MVKVQICVGSSCHLKGSERVVELLQKYAAERGIEGKLLLTASFCTGRCNRQGVTVIVNDAAITGVTEENFATFLSGKLEPALKADGGI